MRIAAHYPPRRAYSLLLLACLLAGAGAQWYESCISAADVRPNVLSNGTAPYVNLTVVASPPDEFGNLVQLACMRSCSRSIYPFFALAPTGLCQCLQRLQVANASHLPLDFCAARCSGLPCGGNGSLSLYSTYPLKMDIVTVNWVDPVITNEPVRFDFTVTSSVGSRFGFTTNTSAADSSNVPLVCELLVGNVVSASVGGKGQDTAVGCVLYYVFTTEAVNNLTVRVTTPWSVANASFLVWSYVPRPVNLDVLLVDVANRAATQPSCLHRNESAIVHSMEAVKLFINTSADFEASVYVGKNLTFMWYFSDDGTTTTSSPDASCTGRSCLVVQQEHVFLRTGIFTVIVNVSNDLGTLNHSLIVVVLDHTIQNFTVSLISPSAVTPGTVVHFSVLIQTAAFDEAMLQVDFGDGSQPTPAIFAITDAELSSSALTTVATALAPNQTSGLVLRGSYGDKCFLTADVWHVYSTVGVYSPSFVAYNNLSGLTSAVRSLSPNITVAELPRGLSLAIWPSAVCYARGDTIEVEPLVLYDSDGSGVPTCSLGTVCTLTNATAAADAATAVAASQGSVLATASAGSGKRAQLRLPDRPGSYWLTVYCRCAAGTVDAAVTIIVEEPLGDLVVTRGLGLAGGKRRVSVRSTVELAASITAGSDVNFTWIVEQAYGQPPAKAAASSVNVEQYAVGRNAFAYLTFLSEGAYAVRLLASNGLGNVNASLGVVVVEQQLPFLAVSGCRATLVGRPCAFTVSVVHTRQADQWQPSGSAAGSGAAAVVNYTLLVDGRLFALTSQDGRQALLFNYTFAAAGLYQLNATASNDVSVVPGRVPVLVQERVAPLSIAVVATLGCGCGGWTLLARLNGSEEGRRSPDLLYEWSATSAALPTSDGNGGIAQQPLGSSGQRVLGTGPLVCLNSTASGYVITLTVHNQVDSATAELNTTELTGEASSFVLQHPIYVEQSKPLSINVLKQPNAAPAACAAGWSAAVDYGDGSFDTCGVASGLATVTHTYSQPGLYRLVLNVSCPVEATGQFDTNPSAIAAPSFQSSSYVAVIAPVSYPTIIGPRIVAISPQGRATEWSVAVDNDSNAAYIWSFSDSSNETWSIGSTAVHVFTRPGNHTVTVTASNSISKATASQNVVAVYPVVEAVAVMPAVPRGRVSNLTVIYSGCNVDVKDTLIADFGDGSELVTAANGVAVISASWSDVGFPQCTVTLRHTYNTSSVYLVTINISNAASFVQCFSVSYVDEPILGLAVTASAYLVAAGDVVSFEAKATSGRRLRFSWDFCIGNISSNVGEESSLRQDQEQQSVTHFRYDVPGTYYVTVAASNDVYKDQVVTATLATPVKVLKQVHQLVLDMQNASASAIALKGTALAVFTVFWAPALSPVVLVFKHDDGSADDVMTIPCTGSGSACTATVSHNYTAVGAYRPSVTVQSLVGKSHDLTAFLGGGATWNSSKVLLVQVPVCCLTWLSALPDPDPYKDVTRFYTTLNAPVNFTFSVVGTDVLIDWTYGDGAYDVAVTNTSVLKWYSSMPSISNRVPTSANSAAGPWFNVSVRVYNNVSSVVWSKVRMYIVSNYTGVEMLINDQILSPSSLNVFDGSRPLVLSPRIYPDWMVYTFCRYFFTGSYSSVQGIPGEFMKVNLSPVQFFESATVYARAIFSKTGFLVNPGLSPNYTLSVRQPLGQLSIFLRWKTTFVVNETVYLDVGLSAGLPGTMFSWQIEGVWSTPSYSQTVSYVFSRAGTYVVSLSANNAIDYAVANATLLVLPWPCSINNLGIVSPTVGGAGTVASFTRSDSIQLEAVMNISCGQFNVWTGVAMRWHIFNASSSGGTEVFLNGTVPDSWLRRSTLVLPPGALPYGTYSAELVVEVIETKVQLTSGPQLFNVIPSNLVALIDGGIARTISLGRVVTLDASRSYDPDCFYGCPSLTFRWSCSSSGVLINPCFDSPYQINSSMVIVNTTNMSKKSNLIQQTKLVQILVVVCRPGTSQCSSNSQAWDFRQIGLLNVTVDCPQSRAYGANNTFDTASQVRLRASCESCPHNSVNYTWKIDLLASSSSSSDSSSSQCKVSNDPSMTLLPQTVTTEAPMLVTPPPVTVPSTTTAVAVESAAVPAVGPLAVTTAVAGSSSQVPVQHDLAVTTSTSGGGTVPNGSGAVTATNATASLLAYVTASDRTSEPSTTSIPSPISSLLSSVAATKALSSDLSSQQPAPAAATTTALPISSSSGGRFTLGSGGPNVTSTSATSSAGLAASSQASPADTPVTHFIASSVASAAAAASAATEPTPAAAATTQYNSSTLGRQASTANVPVMQSDSSGGWPSGDSMTSTTRLPSSSMLAVDVTTAANRSGAETVTVSESTVATATRATIPPASPALLTSTASSSVGSSSVASPTSTPAAAASAAAAPASGSSANGTGSATVVLTSTQPPAIDLTSESSTAATAIGSRLPAASPASATAASPASATAASPASATAAGSAPLSIDSVSSSAAAIATSSLPPTTARRVSPLPTTSPQVTLTTMRRPRPALAEGPVSRKRRAERDAQPIQPPPVEGGGPVEGGNRPGATAEVLLTTARPQQCPVDDLTCARGPDGQIYTLSIYERPSSPASLKMITSSTGAELIVTPDQSSKGDGAEYRINGTAFIGSAMQGSSFYYIRMNYGPKGGQCGLQRGTSEASAAIEMQTPFLLFCDSWNDEDLPITYEVRFSYAPDKSARYVLYRGFNGLATVYLPAGLPEQNYSVIVQLRVYNARGASRTACAQSWQVLPRIGTLKDLFNEVFNDSTAMNLLIANSQNDALRRSIQLFLAQKLFNFAQQEYLQRNASLTSARLHFVDAILNETIRNMLEAQQTLAILKWVLATRNDTKIDVVRLRLITALLRSASLVLLRSNRYREAVPDATLDDAFFCTSAVLAELSLTSDADPGFAYRDQVTEKLKSIIGILITVYQLHKFTIDSPLSYKSPQLYVWTQRLNPMATLSVVGCDFMNISVSSPDAAALPVAARHRRSPGTADDSAAPQCLELRIVALGVESSTRLNAAPTLTVTSLTCYDYTDFPRPLGKRLPAFPSMPSNFVVDLRNYVQVQSSNYTLSKENMSIHSFVVTADDMMRDLTIVIYLEVTDDYRFPVALYESHGSPPDPSVQPAAGSHRKLNQGQTVLHWTPGELPAGVHYLALADAGLDAAPPVAGEVTWQAYTLLAWWSACLSRSNSTGAQLGNLQHVNASFATTTSASFTSDISVGGLPATALPWTLSNCRLVPSTDLDSVRCSCSDSSATVTADVTAQAFNLSTTPLAGFFPIQWKPFVAITVCITISIYVIILIVCCAVDQRLPPQEKLVPLHDNSPDDKQKYIITIETGNLPGAGTTAKISIILHGKHGLSETRELGTSGEAGGSNGAARASGVFRRNSRVTFLLTLPQGIGQLWKVQLWHDNAGHSPSWYLKQITIRDVNATESYFAICEKWFAVEEDDGKVEREFMLSLAHEQKLSFLTVLHVKIPQYMADYHMWTSLVHRPTYSRYGRAERLSVCALAIAEYMALSAAYLDLYIAEYRGEVKLFDLSPEALLVGAVLPFVSYLSLLLVALIFRKSAWPSWRRTWRWSRPASSKLSKLESSGIDNHSYEDPCEDDDTVSIVAQSIQKWQSLQEWAQRHWEKRYQYSFPLPTDGDKSGTDSLGNGERPPELDQQPLPPLVYAVTAASAAAAAASAPPYGRSAPPSYPSSGLRTAGSSWSSGDSGCGGGGGDGGEARLSGNETASAAAAGWQARRAVAVAAAPSASACLPSWCRLLAWLFCIGGFWACMCVTVYASCQFQGHRIIMWLQSVCIAVLTCAFVTQPLAALLAALHTAFAVLLGLVPSSAALLRYTDRYVQDVEQLHVAAAAAARRPSCACRRCSSAALAPLDKLPAAPPSPPQPADDELLQKVAARQRSRHLRLARPPQEKQLIEARKQRIKEKKLWLLVDDAARLAATFALLGVLAFMGDTQSAYLLTRNAAALFSPDRTAAKAFWRDDAPVAAGPSFSSSSSVNRPPQPQRVWQPCCRTSNSSWEPCSCVGVTSDGVGAAAICSSAAAANRSEAACSQQPFGSIKTFGQFWRWSQAELVDILYGQLASHLGSTLVVGRSVRLRQVRVKPAPCVAGSQLAATAVSAAAVCYPPLSASTLATEPFTAGNSTYTYEEASVGGRTSWLYGVLWHYDDGGYSVTLPKQGAEATRAALASLEAADWLDSATRAVIVETTLHNPSTALFAPVTLLCEVDVGGLLLPSTDVYALRLSRHSHRRAWFLLLCELLFFCMLLAQARSTLAAAWLQRLRFLRDPWNIVELTFVMAAAAYAVVTVLRAVAVHDVVARYVSTFHQQFVSMASIGECDQAAKFLLGSMLLLASCRLLRLLRYVEAFARLGSVLRHSRANLAAVVIMYILMVLSWTGLGVGLFSRSSAHFSSYSSSFATVASIAARNVHDSGLWSGYGLSVFTLCATALGHYLIRCLAVAIPLHSISHGFRYRKPRRNEMLAMAFTEGITFIWKQLRSALKISEPDSRTAAEECCVDQSKALPPEFALAEMECQVDELLSKMSILSPADGGWSKSATLLSSSACSAAHVDQSESATSPHDSLGRQAAIHATAGRGKLNTKSSSAPDPSEHLRSQLERAVWLGCSVPGGATLSFECDQHNQPPDIPIYGEDDPGDPACAATETDARGWGDAIEIRHETDGGGWGDEGDGDDGSLISIPDESPQGRVAVAIHAPVVPPPAAVRTQPRWGSSQAHDATKRQHRRDEKHGRIGHELRDGSGSTSRSKRRCGTSADRHELQLKCGKRTAHVLPMRRRRRSIGEQDAMELEDAIGFSNSRSPPATAVNGGSSGHRGGGKSQLMAECQVYVNEAFETTNIDRCGGEENTATAGQLSRPEGCRRLAVEPPPNGAEASVKPTAGCQNGAFAHDDAC